MAIADNGPAVLSSARFLTTPFKMDLNRFPLSTHTERFSSGDLAGLKVWMILGMRLARLDDWLVPAR
jgi:hypothetical protein